MHSISAGSFTARTPRMRDSPSTSSARGASRPRSSARKGDMPSTPIRSARASGPTRAIASSTFRGFQVSAERREVGISGGMPSSQVEPSRWISPLSRARMQSGPKGVRTARQSQRWPPTYLALPRRPSTRTSTPCRSISARTRSRRAARSAAKSLPAPSSHASSPIGFIAGSLEGLVRVAAHLLAAGMRHEDELLAAPPAVAVLPGHGLDHDRHAGLEDQVVVDLGPRVGADALRLAAFEAQRMREEVVVEPGPLPAVRARGDAHELGAGHTGTDRVDHDVGDLLPALVEIAQARARAPDHPRAPHVRGVALVAGDRVRPDDVALARDVVGRHEGEGHVAVRAPRPVGDALRDALEDRVDEGLGRGTPGGGAPGSP